MADIHDDTMEMIKTIAYNWDNPHYDPTNNLVTMFFLLADDLDIPIPSNDLVKPMTTFLSGPNFGFG